MALDPGLAGKTALVTGGGTGIGRAISVALAQQGVNVAIASRTRREGTLAELESGGSRAVFLSVDLTDESQVADLVRRCISKLGGLDLLVCNAAAALHEPALQLSTEAWTATMSTNLLSCMWICREAARHMVANGQGSILIVGSTAQFHRALNQASYHVSKAALATYSTALALELAHHSIRVNLLVPGRYATGLNPVPPTGGWAQDVPMGRPGDPQECGPAAVFLLSDKLSSYITGAQLVVSGGLHLCGPSHDSGDPPAPAHHPAAASRRPITA